MYPVFVVLVPHAHAHPTRPSKRLFPFFSVFAADFFSFRFSLHHQPMVGLHRWLDLAALLAAAPFLAVGLWRFFSVEPNYCVMTYMNPCYLPVEVSQSPHRTKYSLFLYRDHAQPTQPVP